MSQANYSLRLQPSPKAPAELMRRDAEVAYPASDVGVDLRAYRLRPKQATPGNCMPIQVKARAGYGYNLQKTWFERAPGVVLVHVWKITEVPEFYVFSTQAEVEAAVESHAESDSWLNQGGYSVTNPTARDLALMQPHRDRWHRIIDRLSAD